MVNIPELSGCHARASAKPRLDGLIFEDGISAYRIEGNPNKLCLPTTLLV
jgi:hypothetical protein